MSKVIIITILWFMWLTSITIDLLINKREQHMNLILTVWFFHSLIAYAQNYKTYDPCFTTPTPSNPWITDDSELWNLECVRLVVSSKSCFCLK